MGLEQHLKQQNIWELKAIRTIWRGGELKISVEWREKKKGCQKAPVQVSQGNYMHNSRESCFGL
jgi:hypothetical protein